MSTTHNKGIVSWPASSVWIERIGADDAKKRTDRLHTLLSRLKEHAPYYPAIDRWITEKVVPGIKNRGRLGFVGYYGDTPILAAILKKGANTKFCHLSIDDRFQDMKLGYLMFSMMAAEVRGIAGEVHFTLPESLWERESGFFNTFGFTSASIAQSQYRLFEKELRCSVSFGEMWRNVVAQLPVLMTSVAVAGYRVNDGVVLSIREKYAKAVMQGKKKIELRKRFADRWVGRSASVYCAGGSGSLLGTVTIQNVTKAHPEEVWLQYGPDLECSRSEFDHYVGDRTSIFALELADPIPYQSPLPLSQLSHLLGQTLHPPQSYAVHTSSDTWGKALSVAAILHGSVPATY